MSVAGKKISDYPDLLKEWHPVKNPGVNTSEVSAGSNKPRWWLCANGHEFRKTPNGRTNNQRTHGGYSPCPYCGGIKFWTWEKIIEIASDIKKREGFLPPAARFQELGYAMLIQCVYAHGKSWGDLREALGSFDKSSFVESRNGLRWRSHAEASVSNFFYARGIPHRNGQKYPSAYSEISGRKYGYFDLQFESSDHGQIDVEVWGDKPHGHNEKGYARVRHEKEKFNKSREDFLGIHFLDCYNEDSLTRIFRPFIGEIPPHIFDKPHDRIIHTSHWSNADEVIETCRNLAVSQPHGIFPTEEWLRKRGAWKSRPGEAYNTLSIYIKLWIGGIRRLRELLGQPEASTISWSKEKALAELKRWHEQYGKSPRAVRSDAEIGKLSLSKSEKSRASRLSAAIDKHAGGIIRAYQELGIKPSRKAPSRHVPGKQKPE